METRIRQAGQNAYQKIQKMKMVAVPASVYLEIVIIAAVAAVALWFTVKQPWVFIIPVALATILLVSVLSVRARKIRDGEYFLQQSRRAIANSDHETFVTLLHQVKTKWKNNRHIMHYVLIKTYAYLLSQVGADWTIDENEKIIIDTVRLEIAQLIKIKKMQFNPLTVIHRHYLDSYLKIFDMSGFASGSEGLAPYPEQEEEFVCRFFHILEVENELIDQFLQSIAPKVVLHGTRLIESSNIQGFEWFLNRREENWKEYGSFMQEILMGVYSSLFPIISSDSVIDSDEEKAISFLNGKSRQYFASSDSLNKISLEFLRKYAAGILDREHAGEKEMQFILSFAQLFGIASDEAGIYVNRIRKYMELKKIEQGKIPKITPSLNDIAEAVDCYLEIPVEMLQKRVSDLLDSDTSDDRIIRFETKHKGVLFLTATRIQISLRSLHVVRLSDIDHIDLNIPENVLEIYLQGEMGDLYLRTPDNMRVLAVINYLKSK